MVTVPNSPCCPYPGKISLKTPVKDMTLESNGQPVARVTVSPEEEWKTLSWAIVADPVSSPQGESPMFWGQGAALGCPKER